MFTKVYSSFLYSSLKSIFNNILIKVEYSQNIRNQNIDICKKSKNIRIKPLYNQAN